MDRTNQHPPTSVGWEVEIGKGHWKGLSGRAVTGLRTARSEEPEVSYSDVDVGTRRLELFRLSRANRTHVASNKQERVRARPCCWMVGSSTEGWINATKTLENKLEKHICEGKPEDSDGLGFCPSIKGWRDDGGRGQLSVILGTSTGLLDGADLSFFWFVLRSKRCFNIWSWATFRANLDNKTFFWGHLNIADQIVKESVRTWFLNVFERCTETF